MNRSSPVLPSTNINNLIEVNNSTIYIGTSEGLGYAENIEGSHYFYTVNSNQMPEGGNPALRASENTIAVSGAMTSSYGTPEGTGVAYSKDLGNTWKIMEQPTVDSLENVMYYEIQWGGQSIQVFAVTSAEYNVSYDLAISGNYIYSTSWAGGLQRFRYTDDTPKWEIIPLPMDNQSELICGDIDTDTYELNSKDPVDGGNHNHKGFSVFIDNENIFVGTADGINKGVIVDDCIDWEKHITTSNYGISGNWVTGFESGLGKIWAITWASSYLESTGLSYSKDNGDTWHSIDYFTNENIRIYNIKITDGRIYASAIDGLYFSDDSEIWNKMSNPYDKETDISIDLDVVGVYTSLFTEQNQLLYIGTGDGLGITSDFGNSWVIYNQDCAGVPNGTAIEDNCGVCVAPDDISCVQGCDDNYTNDGSELVFDKCNVCGGDNTTCSDCAGVPNGTAIEDNCGVCVAFGDTSCVQDCNGEWGGYAVNDDCGVCNGNNNDMDECGDCFGGGIKESECDCDGNLDTCTLCYTINPENYGNCDTPLGYAPTGNNCEMVTGCGTGNDDEWFFDTYTECLNLGCQNCKTLNSNDYGECGSILGWAWTGSGCELISGCGTGDDEPWFYEFENDCNTRCNWCEEGICESQLDAISSEKPSEFNLLPAYPNPFNPITTIQYSLPKYSKILIQIYDSNGSVVTELVNALIQPGYYSVGWDATDYASGIYFVKMVAGSYVNSQKLILVK